MQHNGRPPRALESIALLVDAGRIPTGDGDGQQAVRGHHDLHGVGQESEGLDRGPDPGPLFIVQVLEADDDIGVRAER